MKDGFHPSCFPTLNVGTVSVGDTLYSPILNVGSTVNGLYSVGWQQKRLRSLICLLVAITHKGSGAAWTSRIKAVVFNEACFLPSLSNRNHGSSSSIWSAAFCALCCFAYREKSFTCCRPLGSSPELDILKFLQVRLPPSYILHREVSFGSILQQKFCAFTCSDVRLRRLLWILMKTWHNRMFNITFKWIYWTKQNLWSFPLLTIKKWKDALEILTFKLCFKLRAYFQKGDRRREFLLNNPPPEIWGSSHPSPKT